MTLCLLMDVLYCSGFAACNEPFVETGACYWLEDSTESWAKAYKSCIIKKGTLAVINSENLLDWILSKGMFYDG